MRCAYTMHAIVAAVVALFHHVLPSLSTKFLQDFISNENVHTLVVMLPNDSSDELAQDESSSEEESSEGEADEHDEDSDTDSIHDDQPPGPVAASSRSGDTIGVLKHAHVEEAGGGLSQGEGSEVHSAAVGLRQRLAGAVSYEDGERLGQRLLQVSLLGVRLRYQRSGVGARLLRTLLNGEASPGRPEAAIVWADTRAVPFFKRHNFTDDPILNSRYREISKPWARSTLMSTQLPPPIPDLSGAAGASSSSSWVAAEPLDEQLASWRHAHLLGYSRELCLIERMHAEIRMLREKVSLQQGHVAALQAENAKLKRNQASLQSEFDKYRRARYARDAAMIIDADEEASVALTTLMPPLPPAEGARSSPPRFSGLPREKSTSVPSHAAPPAVEISVEQVREELRKVKPHSLASCSDLVLSEWMPTAPSEAASFRLRYDACRCRLSEPGLTLRLFYAAPRVVLQHLLSSGFDEVPLDPLGLTVYGRGWYFSKYAAHADNYTEGGGCLLLAEVAVGNAETVVRRDPARGAPSPGYDSIVIPGRRLPSQRGIDSTSGEVNEEYVVFDGSQVMPLGLLFYNVV